MTCAVCCSSTDRNYANSILTGREDVFCFFCFLAWYEGGLTQEAQIRRASVALREEGWP